jgi:hypothetical protein
MRHYGDDDTPLDEPKATSDAKANAGAVDATALKKAGAARRSRPDRREGAGFYWHTASLFY